MESSRGGVQAPLGRRPGLLAGLFLAAVLLIGFSPAIFGGRTLLLASWDAPSVMSSGAYDTTTRPAIRLQRTPDPGASAWQNEAWYKLLSDQFWNELNIPLWNPYNAYGTPLLADAISQPFFPPTTLLSLHVTPWTYDLFIISRLLLGGILMGFFARQFLTVLPSLFSAVTFMLSGYFIIYLNIAHLSVEVLTPGVFLAFEHLLRKNSWGAVTAVAAMILLGMTGGMPESLFLILAFGSLFFVCRLLCTPEFRAQARTLFIKFVASIVLGFALSAFLLLPFLEFLRVAHDVHQTSNVGGLRGGLIADGDYRSTIQYLLPLIFGPILNSIFSDFVGWSGLRGYWGIIPFFFSVLALLTLFARRISSASNSRRFLTIFFATTLVLMVLKRFGNVAINWIGYLPLSEMVLYTKYQEPLMALCIAMLGGIGFALLVERRVTNRQLLATALITLAAILSLAALYLPAVRSTAMKTSMFYSVPVKTSLFFYVSVACGIALVLVVALLARSTNRAPDPMRPRLLRAVVVLLSLELLFNFIVPSFYLLSSLPTAKADPYKGAPYIEFIHANNADYSRVFARELLLYPNWSSAFGLADVRSLDAMHYKRYREFTRNLLLPSGAEARHHGDLADRFTGADFAYNFDTALEKRFLVLSSIKYLISDSNYSGWSKSPDGIVEQHKGNDVFNKVYDQEVRVFEVPGVLPRAAIYSAIDILPDSEVLARLRNSSFDPRFTVTVSRESLSPEQAAASQTLAAAAGAPVRAASILRYQSQHVRVEAETDAPALLMLNDTDFPGWRAYVNGQPARIVNANYLFRGVFVPAGKSIVDFRYEPRSFRAGVAVSLAALAVLAGLTFRERRRRRAPRNLGQTIEIDA